MSLIKKNSKLIKTGMSISTFGSNLIFNDPSEINNITLDESKLMYKNRNIIKQKSTSYGQNGRGMIIDGFCSLGILDLQLHIITLEAYKNIFQQSLENVKILVNHDYNKPLVGRMLELSLVTLNVKSPKFQDPKRQYVPVYGLYVKIEFLNTNEGISAYQNYQSDAVPSFSIGFEPIKFHSTSIEELYNPNSHYSKYFKTVNFQECNNKKANVWILERMNLIEISLVPLPANPYCHGSNYASRLGLIDLDNLHYVNEQEYSYKAGQNHANPINSNLKITSKANNTKIDIAKQDNIEPNKIIRTFFTNENFNINDNNPSLEEDSIANDNNSIQNQDDFLSKPKKKEMKPKNIENITPANQNIDNKKKSAIKKAFFPQSTKILSTKNK